MSVDPKVARKPWLVVGPAIYFVFIIEPRSAPAG